MGSLVFWVAAVVVTGVLTFEKLSLVFWIAMLAVIGFACLLSLLTLNQAQLELANSNKAHSRTKRQVQEHQLKIDRFEYDSKKAGELRRIVLNSTQEKDHSLRNMANALDHSMDEIVDLTGESKDELLTQVRTRAESMKRYAADLKSLAQLELKSELPSHNELNFLDELQPMMERWVSLGKTRKVKVKLDNPEEQMPLISDVNWIENLLARVVQALIRMNENSVLNVHLIGYMDADLADALRIEFSIDGRQFSEKQLQHVMTEYVSIIEDGQEIGPGLAFVVGRRMAQILNGYIEVANSEFGIEVLIVLPRNPAMTEELEESNYS
jgi:K+-sensing histidine kinase KdpD